MNSVEGGEIELKEAQEVAFLVKTGLTEQRHMNIAYGASLLAIVEVIARERGIAVEELVIVREGEGIVAVDLIIESGHPHKRRYHVHHRSLVKVTVFYGAKHQGLDFKRHDTIDDVFEWAVALEAFGIDEAMAGEFVLVRHGQKDELPGDEHIGHLAGRETELKLDLVRGDIANG